jgi:N-acetylneuraminate synthase
MSVFTIAEIGINHNGDMNTAKKLIDLATICGCDAVKFQKRNINAVYTEEFLSSYRESSWGVTQRAQKEGLEFGKNEYQEIDQYCKQIHIPWFASAWDIGSQKFLQQFNLEYNKIASAMIVDAKLLKEVAAEKKHTFISTGMSNLEDVEKAVRIFQQVECPFELMHCVSTYPMDPEDANLRCIETLRDHFHCDVGYSGHESGLAISYAAVALGATSLERHITLDRAMSGSDQSASVSPEGLRTLLGAVRLIEKAIKGDGAKRILDAEKPIAKKLRLHLEKTGGEK